MEKKEFEEKLAEFETRFEDLSKKVGEKIDDLTVSFSGVLQSLKESKSSKSKDDSPPPPKAYEEASHAVELLKNLSKITKEISDSNTKAIMEGLAVGVKLGEVAGQAREAESRLEDQESEIDQLSKLLEKASSNGGGLNAEEQGLLNQIIKEASKRLNLG